MKKLLTKILQSYADFIIYKLENVKDESDFQIYYLRGLYLDNIAVSFNIELK